MDTRGQRRVKSLLLMYLLVVKAAGDCPKPDEVNNTILTNESLLLNEFPEGVEITLECSNGYYKVSGSDVIMCIDNKWTKSDLVCKKKDCGQPPPQEHMKFNTSSGTLLEAVVKVTCDKGYQITGSSYKYCFASGWSGKAKCEIVTCDTPPEIANGTRRWSSEEDPEFETTVHYSCNEGYSLIGNEIIVCTEAGEYDSDPPECKEDRTTVPAPTSQSQVSWTTTVPTSAAHTVHGAKSSTTSTTIRSTLPQGFGGSVTAEEKAATPTVTSATSSSFQDMDDGAEDTGKHIVPLAASAAIVSLGGIVLVSLWYRFNLRRKGSKNLSTQNSDVCVSGLLRNEGSQQEII